VKRDIFNCAYGTVLGVEHVGTLKIYIALSPLIL
jgi:hypothetical protein